MSSAIHLQALAVLLATTCTASVHAYPIDGYAETGIRRLEADRRVEECKIPGSKQPSGALLPTEKVDLRLLEFQDMELPAPDPAFTGRIMQLLGHDAGKFGVAVLDLTDPQQPRYAEFRGEHMQNVGSVGKLVVALGLFQALSDAWPEDIERRRKILKETILTADEFSHSDHHNIKIFDVATSRMTRRAMQDGDKGSLWEYLDWMLSASSNSAASMVMRDAMLLRHYGKAYPVPDTEIRHFFDETPEEELISLFQETFFEPITRNGLDLSHLRQGSLFTSGGNDKIKAAVDSYGTARELMRFVLRMEQGRLVDEFSSREIKRLLYMTERRIRYASSPALADSAVYFKSGSLYKCRKENGFDCGPSRGNVSNYMNSIAVVEHPSGENRLFYISTLISNVLRRNSSLQHRTLGTEIHHIIEDDHAATRQARDLNAQPRTEQVR